MTNQFPIAEAKNQGTTIILDLFQQIHVMVIVVVLVISDGTRKGSLEEINILDTYVR